MGDVGGWGAAAAGVADGTAPTEMGACSEVCGGTWDNNDDRSEGEMTDMSQRYSSSYILS